jgi:predicted acetyltransferase
VSELVDPDPALHRSFIEALDEFHAAGEARHAGLPDWPAEAGFAGVRFTAEQLEDAAEFDRFCRFVRDQRLEDAPRPPSYVPSTEKWIVDSGDYLGRITVRHRLTDTLLTWGGHIGYGVRPSARRRGHATAALARMLQLCPELGIDRALVTCDVDNVGSRRTIERNGGVYEDTREGKLRFWVTCTSPG